MSTFKTDAYVEFNVYYALVKGQQQFWDAPGYPPSIEINDIEFVDKNGNALKHIEQIKNWVIKEYTRELVDSAWDNER